jgi:hypothetical protein
MYANGLSVREQMRKNCPKKHERGAITTKEKDISLFNVYSKYDLVLV